ncbi:MAG: radical SAM protein [Planctomycetaceae bacterium]|nr:B12-binding domain-containing radical SAM protein [Planctomycetaceae bacterium]
MRIVLLRPPRYVWPFNSETSAFWQPLGLLCLAGAARRHFPNAAVEVWDAPAANWGWATLQRRLATQPIDVLGVGEETVSAHEALRAAAMVRELHPSCAVVAGGTYFAHTIQETLQTGLIDAVVRGEGEITFVELLKNLGNRAAWDNIPGMAFMRDGQVVRTPARELIDDLDALPMPAYDLLDMSLYGRGSRNHPDLVSIEHSRGCTDSCGFCILWKHMGRSVDGNGLVRPCWRTQSPARSYETVQHLHDRFGRRTFGWVDPTFNASPEWSDAWAELMLAGDLMDARGRPRTLHTAWLRADGVVRDEKLGVLDKLVRAGLRQVMIGLERPDESGLASLGKHNNSLKICREAFAIFREKYPSVYTIGTVIFGLSGDTRDSLARLVDCQYRLGMDYCFLIPLTPNPGTAAAEAARSGGYIANADLASYNFHTPVCRTDTLTLRDLESTYWRLMLRPQPRRLMRSLRTLLTGDKRKRRVHRALLAKGTRIAATSLIRAALHPRDKHPALHSRRPKWYDS